MKNKNVKFDFKSIETEAITRFKVTFKVKNICLS
jgi:hypothetical protein